MKQYDSCISQRENETSKKLRLKEFRLNQLLNSYINSSHMTIKIPAMTGFLMVYVILGFFGTIRFIGKLPIESYIIFPVITNNCVTIMVLVLLPAAILNKLSKVVAQKIRSSSPFVVNKLIKREMKALREFGIRLGVLKRIKFGNIAAFLFSISNYTLSLLVAFPEK